MSDEKPHPITTPKGAAVLTIVFAAASTLGPFLFNLQTALVFAITAACVITWVYWRELVGLVIHGRGDSTLVIPTAAVLVIVGMSYVSIQNSKEAPKAIPPPSVDDIANKVANLILPRLLQGQSPAVQAPPASKNSSSRSFTPPDRPVETRSAASPAKPTPSATAGPSTDWAKLFEQTNQSIEMTKAYGACLDDEVNKTTTLYGFQVRAVNDLNAYSNSLDDEKIAMDYGSWLSEVNQYLASNASSLPSRAAFDAATDPDPRPSFLFIHNSGNRIWRAFNAKRQALVALENAYAHSARCPPTALLPALTDTTTPAPQSRRKTVEPIAAAIPDKGNTAQVGSAAVSPRPPPIMPPPIAPIMPAPVIPVAPAHIAPPPPAPAP